MSSKAASDAELLQASLAGSRQAFGAIVEKYQGLVCGITYSTTGNRPRSEELAQETFVRAWRELRQLRDLGRFRAWLSTIARNAARKSIIKQGRDAADGAEPIADLRQIKSPEPGPVEHAISREQEAVVWGALKEIPETYREPLVLFYRQQRSVSQVAAELELSEDVVKQRLSRGRKLLKAELASVVEEVIGRTGPGKVFTVAVIAALPAIVPQVASAAIAATIAKSSAAAKSAWFLTSLGALLGPLLGLYGASIGIRASIANAKSPRERRFLIRVLWLGLAYYLVGITVLTMLLWMRSPFWGVSFLVFLLGFPVWAFWNRLRMRQIQKEEGTYTRPERRVLEMPRGNIVGAYSGSVFGTLLWLYMTAQRAKDWPALAFIVIAGVIIVWLATKLCLRARRHFYRIAAALLLAVGSIYLLVINLRWERWIAFFKESGRNLKYTQVPLWKLNLVIAIVITGLVLINLIGDLKQQKVSRKKQPAQDDQKGPHNTLLLS
ncbi:MAG TPA: sigma-70 family RNA polymerase sigma factor [Sedimentisphaerales bacterium]|nr:sigma-70 family RNA polymerase sigma factor [Sedimentisphaerales bacterium]